MAKHLIMDYSGHSTVEFDKMDPVELKAAQDRFVALVGDGHTAATRKKGETEYTKINKPNQEQDETLFVPHMQGG